jgi:murein DD-endopeptidase MepM/ murein hydrolase activator NlpD
MTFSAQRIMRLGLLGTALVSLAACTDPLDWDLRRGDGMLNTAGAAQRTTERPPEPDARGVISFPTYQAVVARRGDSVADVAARAGEAPEAVARYNGLRPDDRLREGEVLVLPGAGGAAGATGAAPGQIDITTIASGAIDRAEQGNAAGGAVSAAGGVEPIRHRVQPGETTYSIARRYGVSPRSLAEWNGLGPDLSVRSGQTLMIPPVLAGAGAGAGTAGTAPGAGSPTPTPPSAARPLPGSAPAPANRPAPATPQSPNLAADRSAQSQLAMPATGPIIREYVKGSNEGIDIGAPAGSTVRAAEAGTVAAITRDTDQVTIVVIRHQDNLLTVYANVDSVTVAKDDKVSRGQAIGKVRNQSPSFLHFEVRRGFDSVDPMPFLK